MSDDRTGPVSVEEAHGALVRFINSHFRNPGEKARATIPADPMRDDDIRLGAFIRQAGEVMQERDSLRAEVSRLTEALNAANAIIGQEADRTAEIQAGLDRMTEENRRLREALGWIARHATPVDGMCNAALFMALDSVGLTARAALKGHDNE